MKLKVCYKGYFRQNKGYFIEILTKNKEQIKFKSSSKFIVCLFVALRPKSTAMVIAGRSVHLITLFPGQA